MVVQPINRRSASMALEGLYLLPCWWQRPHPWGELRGSEPPQEFGQEVLRGRFHDIDPHIPYSWIDGKHACRGPQEKEGRGKRAGNEKEWSSGADSMGHGGHVPPFPTFTNEIIFKWNLKAPVLCWSLDRKQPQNKHMLFVQCAWPKKVSHYQVIKKLFKSY